MGFHLKLPNIKLLQIDEHSKWHDNPHSHDDNYQISLPLNGDVQVKLNNQVNHINIGHSVVANPNDLHGHFFQSDNCSLVILGFDRENLNDWLSIEKGLKEEVVFDNDQVFILNDLKLNLNKWISQYILSENKDSLNIDELEFNIFNYTTNIMRGSHNVKEAVHHVSDTYMNRVLEYIHSNFSSEINVKTLALIAQQSKFSFIRDFSQLTGLTPYQYILSYRIDRGKALLSATNKSITEISHELGFSSSSHFYKNFIKFVGCSPKFYRENK